MTDPDHYSRPERFVERGIARRHLELIRQRGFCLVCVHRDTSGTYWGKSVCSLGVGRMHPHCETDGRSLKFTVDEAAIEKFKQGEMKNAA